MSCLLALAFERITSATVGMINVMVGLVMLLEQYALLAFTLKAACFAANVLTVSRCETAFDDQAHICPCPGNSEAQIVAGPRVAMSRVSSSSEQP